MTTDYSNCVIYKLFCKDANISDIYIGSTVNIRSRMSDHKGKCNNPNSNRYMIRVYQFIREHGGWDNWTMIALEEFRCNTKMEKEKMELKYVKELTPTLNIKIPANYQTGDIYDDKEYQRLWRGANKDKIKDDMKHWRKANKERVSIQRRKKCECECGTIHSYHGRHEHKRTKKHQMYLLNQTKPQMNEMYNILTQRMTQINEQMDIINKLIY